MNRSGALTELRVVEVSRRIAGGLVGVLLADQGADVLALDISGLTDPDTSWRARGKRRAALDPGSADDRAAVAALLAGADVVIDDLLPGELAAAGLDLAAARGGNPGLIGCRLPGFPDGDPRADELDPEGVVCAASGIYEVPFSRQPAYTSIPIGSIIAALYGACGVLGALLARDRDGAGQDVVVPRSDAAVAAQELLALFLVDPPKVWDTLRWAASPFITNWRCKDGQWIYAHLGLAAHLTRAMAALEALGEGDAAEALRAAASVSTRRDPSALGSVWEARRIRAVLTETFARRDAADWERVLSEAGLCVAVCRDNEGWRTNEHALGAEQIIDLDGRLQPGIQARLRGAAGAARAGEGSTLGAGWEPREVPAASADPAPDPAPDASAESAPLSGVRVMDLTQVIAGPVAARTLAELGAEVLRIENPRMAAGWVEPFHVAFNRGKRSVSVDLTSEAGRARLWALAEDFKPDVVLHNLRPGAAERLGLGEAAWRERFPAVVFTHMTAYGTAGPWGDRPGWEQTAQAAAGLQVAYGGAASPDLYPLPLNDLGTGLAGAFAILLGLRHRGRTGEGQRAETCLTATATLLMSESLFPTSSDLAAPSSLGAGPLRRFYKAKDGWFFLDLDAADFPRLVGVQGLRALAGRSPRTSGDLMASLFSDAEIGVWRARIKHAGLQDVVAMQRWERRSAVFRDATLRARGMVVSRAQPRLGEVTEIMSPLTLSRTPTVELPPARQRGGDGDGAPALPVPAGGWARRRSELAWLGRQITWALYLLSTRL